MVLELMQGYILSLPHQVTKVRWMAAELCILGGGLVFLRTWKCWVFTEGSDWALERWEACRRWVYRCVCGPGDDSMPEWEDWQNLFCFFLTVESALVGIKPRLPAKQTNSFDYCPNPEYSTMIIIFNNNKNNSYNTWFTKIAPSF